MGVCNQSEHKLPKMGSKKLLTLILRMSRWRCCCLFFLDKLPIHRLCITATKSLLNYRTYKTTNCWRSFVAHFDGLSIQHLLPSIIVFIMIWTYCLSLLQIETWPCGKANRSNIVALFVLTWLKFMYLTKSSIAPAIHLFINWYSQASTHHSPIIYL